jgi:hypothetical protein
VSHRFHPIVASAVSFLLLVDCARVAEINRDYHAKFWNNLLRNPRRKLHTTIPITLDSRIWLRKYASVLQYQTLTWKLPEAVMESISAEDPISPIPCLDLSTAKLVMFNGVTAVPDGIKSISLCDTILGKRLPDHVKRVRCNNNWSDACHFMPNALERLTIKMTKLEFGGFPHLPHLTKLSLHRPEHEKVRLSGIVSLIVLRKCPALQLLVGAVDLSSLIVHKLVLRIHDLVDISVLKNITCQELDLSGCPKIVNFSAVAHIPLVITA